MLLLLLLLLLVVVVVVCLVVVVVVVVVVVFLWFISFQFSPRISYKFALCTLLACVAKHASA